MPGVGTRVVFEDDKIKVWEFNLEPGEQPREEPAEDEDERLDPVAGEFQVGGFGEAAFGRDRKRHFPQCAARQGNEFEHARTEARGQGPARDGVASQHASHLTGGIRVTHSAFNS